MNILLDTNILSELMRAQPNESVVAWVGDKATDALYTSVITEAEGLYGLQLMPQGKRRDLQTMVFQTLLERLFQKRIITFGRREAACYAGIMASRRGAGRPISQSDAMIAAIAKVNDMALATRNIKDFQGLDLKLINPFETGD